MAYINQSSSSTQRVLAGGDEIYVGYNIKLVVEDTAILGPDGENSVRVDGTVASLSTHGISLTATNDSNEETRVMIGVGGRASGSLDSFANYGVRMQGGVQILNNAGDVMGGSGVYGSNATSSTVVNSGSIRAIDDFAAALDIRNVDDMTIANSGLIEGGRFAAYVNGSSLHLNNTGVMRSAVGDTGKGVVSIGIGGARAEIWNDGEISGEMGLELLTFAEIALVNSGDLIGAGDAALSVSNGGDVRVDNSGLIVGSEGLEFQSADAAHVRNSGEIAGLTGAAVDAAVLAASVALSLWNSGELRGGGGVAVNAGGSDDAVRNIGEIFGDVALGDGVNLLRNSGEIEGGVVTGASADRVVNRGGVGDDVETGGTADVVINRGVVGGDVKLGAGNDLYKARQGGEVDGRVQGGDDNDRILGSSEDDSFEGGGGFDVLKGRGGDDDLRGGAGEDTLDGGQGDDEMSGGINADLFRIGRHSGDDRITDWTDGEDRLDLRALNIEISTSVGDVKAASQNRAGGVVIIDLDALGGDGSLEVAGWNVNQMTSDDFIF
ncbi:hypothetical protein P2H44_25175 [Albimonas sp. CAU 1670]|uniref:calcium-binding protein n=1 Tax=Albimonas sp. CAU 1670 TaxID=3032599 RepID=UPI0023DC8474|nr:hypothetical protein [Albimonas sp. CAU 1670]MDF2235858.1 hypothetical protein [Albimonas sp. CAU 1670]